MVKTDPPRPTAHVEGASASPKADADATKKSVPACPVPNTKRRQRSERRRWYETGADFELYEVSQVTSSKEDERRFQEKKEQLLDLQLQHKQIRIAEAKARHEDAKVRREEAEERKIEARIYRKIAEKELENCK